METFLQKIFPFVGSDRGGRAAACSLIQTCNLHRIEPFAYLADILRRLPSYPINRVTKLLRFRWQPGTYPPVAVPAYRQDLILAITGIRGRLRFERRKRLRQVAQCGVTVGHAERLAT
jgi:hypothetical protein